MGDSLGKKLKTARSLAGFSTRKVAEKLSQRYPVSHATIANYEKNHTTPPMDILVAMASLYERPITWFLQQSTTLRGVRYRNLKSRTRSSDLLRFEADAQRWLDAYRKLEEHVGLKRPPLSSPKTKTTDGPDDFAREVRRKAKIPVQEPIPSIVELLERFGIRVVEVATDLRIDGLAAAFGDEHVIVLNPDVSNDRMRLNAAHELAHVLYGDCNQEGSESKEQEQRAFAFASSLLLPNQQLKRAFETRSMVRLVRYKEKFGISLAAMVYRAEKQGFIRKSDAKKLWVEFSRRGWRTKEPGTVRPDRAIGLEQLIDDVLTSGKMSLKEVADLCGVRSNEILNRLDAALGIDRPEMESAEPIIKFPD